MAEDRVQVLVRVRPILASEQQALGLDPSQVTSMSQPTVAVAPDGKTVRAELPVDFANEKLTNHSNAAAMTCKSVRACYDLQVCVG